MIDDQKTGSDDLRRQRRLALAVFDAEEIIRGIVGRPICEAERRLALPSSVHVLEVQYRLEYGGFMVLLADPTFDPVPPGGRPPILFDTVIYVTTWYPEFMP